MYYSVLLFLYFVFLKKKKKASDETNSEVTVKFEVIHFDKMNHDMTSRRKLASVKKIKHIAAIL